MTNGFGAALARIRKALVAGGVAFGGSVLNAAEQGGGFSWHLTQAQWTSAALFGLVAGVSVFAVPNRLQPLVVAVEREAAGKAGALLAGVTGSELVATIARTMQGYAAPAPAPAAPAADEAPPPAAQDPAAPAVPAAPAA